MAGLWNAWVSSAGFMPHGHCYLWDPWLLWLHVVSDSLIFLAYFAIPGSLVRVARHRADLPFNWILLCFGAFIVSCGLTHLMEVWTVWHPSYWLSGAIKVVTAVASLWTAGLLAQLVPKLLALPSHEQLQRVTHALELSEARFRAAVEGSTDAFYILEACRDERGSIYDFEYAYANPQTRTRIPPPVPDQLVGTRISELLPRDVISHFARVMEQGVPAEDELQVDMAGLRPFWAHVQVVPLGTGVAVTSRDITRRKEAERALKQAEERFRALLEAAPDAMVIVNDQGEILFVNTQVTRLFQYEKQELLGQSAEILVSQHDRRGERSERRAEYLRQALTGEMTPSRELVGHRKDGSEFPFEISVSPLQTDTGLLVTGAIRDISARKWIENALKLSNRELEAFSYSVAHDLRAPLRGMSGFAQILLDEHAGALDAEGRDCLQEIVLNARHMSELIDALLSLSRVSRDELRLEPVDVSALASSIAAELARAEPERKVDVTVQPGLSATLDPTLARTLLVNLIGNAWKFTSRTEGARIEVGATTERGAHTFFVRDNGAGFDASYAEKLFTPFQRLHTAQEFPGTGIGLATVRRIVHRHGGQIWAQAQAGAGATFYFSMPVTPPGAQI